MERRTFSWQVKVKLTSFSPPPSTNFQASQRLEKELSCQSKSLVLSHMDGDLASIYLIFKRFSFKRKLQSWNRWSLGLGMCISFGLSLIGNFQLHSHRTSAGGKSISKALKFHSNQLLYYRKVQSFDKRRKCGAKNPLVRCLSHLYFGQFVDGDA